MIAPSTVFLLQFAKHRPECARKLASPTSVAFAPAPKKDLSTTNQNPPVRRTSLLRRLFEQIQTVPTRN